MSLLVVYQLYIATFPLSCIFRLVSPHPQLLVVKNSLFTVLILCGPLRTCTVIIFMTLLAVDAVGSLNDNHEDISWLNELMPDHEKEK